MATYHTMTRGEARQFAFTLAGLPSGGLAAGALRFEAWRDLQDTRPIIQKDNSNFTVVTNGDNATPGVCTLDLAHGDTAGLPAWVVTLDYRVWFIETATNKPTVIHQGFLTVEP